MWYAQAEVRVSELRGGGARDEEQVGQKLAAYSCKQAVHVSVSIERGGARERNNSTKQNLYVKGCPAYWVVSSPLYPLAGQALKINDSGVNGPAPRICSE